jgi:CubicO group peptidase (beta-lactamase class C family)
VAEYLGTGWTSAAPNKEQLIKVSHLLTMTSGLDDSLGDNVDPANLQYVADAGTRWAYHNVYVKLQDVVSEVSNKSWSAYFNENLRDKIGMNGIWFSSNEDLSVYRSTTKSMARFGLLMSRGGKWFDQQIVPAAFCNTATQTAQNINNAYGYMWWINGESSYRLPQVQFQFNGSLIPNGPSDMYCALGKNDQKIYIVPSRKLVVIRMGDAADGTNFALSGFDNELWGKINSVIE